MAKMVVAMAAAVALGSCAAGPQGAVGGSGGQCFNASMLQGFESLPGGLVLVRAGGNRTFALETGGDCPDINWARGLGVRTSGGGSWICSGIDAQLVVPSPIGAQYCSVRSVQALTREEARALRASRR